MAITMSSYSIVKLTNGIDSTIIKYQRKLKIKCSRRVLEILTLRLVLMGLSMSTKRSLNL